MYELCVALMALWALFSVTICGAVLCYAVQRSRIPPGGKTLDRDFLRLPGSIRLRGTAIGSGGFGLIFEADADLGNGQATVVAVKIPRLQNYSEEALKGSKQMLKVDREARLWHNLRHHHIVPLLGISYDPEKPFIPQLVMPLFGHGDILRYLKCYPDANKTSLIMEIAEGLLYLHETASVVHGDMKANNVLVDDHGRAQITDFGLSRAIGSHGFTSENLHGNLRWMAPELLDHYVQLFRMSSPNEISETDSLPKHTKQSDMWAFGMTILEIFTEKAPFFSIKNDLAVAVAVVRDGRLPTRDESFPMPDKMWKLLIGYGFWSCECGKRATINCIVDALKML